MAMRPTSLRDGPFTMGKPSWMFRGYSECWRRNKSVIEAVEIVNSLRALRKVAGYVGSNVGRVEWLGLTDVGSDRSSIIELDPSFIFDDYPIPPGKMDILVGIVVHEAFKRREWHEMVWDILEKEHADLKFLQKDVLFKMVEVGEDIYADSAADKSILGLYAKKARDFVFTRLPRDPMLSPTAATLFEIWRMKAQNIKDPGEFEPLYKEPLEILLNYTKDLTCVIDQSNSVVERCKLRSKVYWQIWQSIVDQLGPWRKDPITYIPRTDKGSEQKSLKRKRIDKISVKGVVSEGLSDEILGLLSAGTKDLTTQVRDVSTNKDEVINTSICEFENRINPAIDPYMVSRLKGLFYRYAPQVTVTERGLKSGKVDGRKLFRAATTGRCFKEKHSFPEIAWNISILIDASRSMEGPKWRLIETIVGNIFRALEGHRNRLQIYGYFESDYCCIISPLIKGDKLFTIPVMGRTPSGQAIIAAGILMKRDARKRYLIHITDGESNIGTDVKDSIDYCERENIELITLGCAYKDKDLLLEQYGKYVEFVDQFEELPNALENLFKRRIFLLKKLRSDSEIEIKGQQD
ncbi:MAG: vWA domain-containing protein [Thermodesulfobacteriota bacterium]|nr:vWA domain-containing protein [Thermodesulfobacteriota bacterium]